MADSKDAVGSVAEEAMKLIFALSTNGSGAGSDEKDSEHVCTNTWCPLCQMVNYVRDHPEAVERVTQSAADLARSVLHLVEQANPPKSTETPKDVR